MKIKEELKELKLKSLSELQRLLALNREKVRDLRFKDSQNQVKNVREIRVLKKRISRILTIINSKRTNSEAKTKTKQVAEKVSIDKK